MAKTIAYGEEARKALQAGIDKLADVFDQDIRTVRARIDTMSELGKNYKSFAGIKEGMDGSTKFIIETEGVK